MSDGRELTDVEKLAAVETYLKALAPIAKDLRAKVTQDMGARHAERDGAYLGDVKLGAVGYSGGRKTAKVTDTAAALKWCIDKYPDEIVRAVNPSFLSALLDVAKAKCEVGENGYDPRDGEVLDFIEVSQGSPFVTVTTTKEGVARMEALAHGFAGMLESAPTPGPTFPTNNPYDPDLADRLENGTSQCPGVPHRGHTKGGTTCPWDS